MMSARPGTFEGQTSVNAPQPDRPLLAMIGDVDVILKDLKGSGEMVGGQALADVSTANSVKVRGGEVTATDGPLLEAKKHRAGWPIVHIDNEERAIEIAAPWPDARYAAMVVRTIMHMSGQEM